MTKLPIDTVPNAHGHLHFKWSQVVGTPAGKRTVECEGPLAIGADEAVAGLIALAKRQASAIEKLTAENAEMRKETCHAK